MTCFRIILPFLLSATLQGQQAKIDDIIRAKQEQAALAAIEQSISSLQARQLKTDQLTAIMLDDPAAHARRANSQSILHKKEQQALENAVRDQLISFASTRRELPKGWADQVMTRQGERINKTIDNILSTGFEEAFSKARGLAVQAQRGNLNLRLKPTYADVENIAGPYRIFATFSLDEAQHKALESGSAVLNKYVAEAHKGTVVFEENEAYLRDQAAAIFSNEITELWEQLQYIVHYTGGNEIERSRIELAIAKGLSSLPSGKNAFPVAKTAMRDRAGELEQDLFLSFLKSQLATPCPALPSEALLKNVPGNPNELPGTLDEHVTKVVSSVSSRTASQLLEKWTSRITGQGQAALRHRLGQVLQNEAGGQILSMGIETCVREAIRPYRDLVAAKEVAAKWPGVANLSLSLDDDAIGQLSRANTSEDAEQVQVLTNAKFHMEEAQNFFRANRRTLLNEGMLAVHTQRSFVEDPGLKSQFQNEAAAHRGQESFRRKIQQNYETEVLKRWNQQRQSLLARMSGEIPDQDKYKGLFRVTREEIREILKTDAVQVPEATSLNGQAGPGGGGSGTGGGTGDGLGPGAGGGGGGSAGGGASNCPPETPSSQHWWLIFLAAVMIMLTAWIAYRWGRKNGVKEAIGSH